MKHIYLLAFLFSSFNSQAQQASSQLKNKAVTLRRFLEQQHYKPLTWNDSSSNILYKKWMGILDDENLLFTQQDLNVLNVYSTRLDDELLGKEWGFFDKSMQLYNQALKRVDTIIKATVAKPIDFSKPDNIQWPFNAAAATRDELVQRWQQYLKWRIIKDIAEPILDTATSASTTQKMPAVFAAQEVKARDKRGRRELNYFQTKLQSLEADINAMANDYLETISWCYDPHTQYMSIDTRNDFQTRVSGQEYSAGFEVDEDEQGALVISFLTPGGPAWRNGELHKGDVLLKIKAGNQPAIDLENIGDDALENILGGSGVEKIAVTVRTAGGTQKTVELIKEKIVAEEDIVKSYIINSDKKIGYIKLPGFYVKEGDKDENEGCSNDVAKEVVKLKKDSIQGLVLDLRFNGGGSLWESLGLAGIFIDQGTFVTTRDKTGKVRYLKDPNRGTIYDGPMLVLVNTMSASASELVSAVLQDYRRALIVGSPTYGKGSAQIVLPMDTSGTFKQTSTYDNYVKVTEEKFYRVDGTTTQWKGVVPDIELPDLYAVDTWREKGKSSALQPDMSKAAIYQPLPALPIAVLKSKSAERVAASPFFKAVNNFKSWYGDGNDQRTIPLQWTAYCAYYKAAKDKYKILETDTAAAATVALNVSKSRIDQERSIVMTDENRSVDAVNIKKISRDPYITEAVKIMTDWIH